MDAPSWESASRNVVNALTETIAMSVNATHPDYDASLPAWLRARDVIAGEDAVKSGGEKYLPRLGAQTDEEYDAYRARASLFNATARTADGSLGLPRR